MMAAMKHKPAKRLARRVQLKKALVAAGIERIASRRAIRAVLILLGLEHT